MIILLIRLDYFEQRLRPIVSGINKTMVCWEELFDDGVPLDPNTIVQVWKNHNELQAVFILSFVLIPYSHKFTPRHTRSLSLFLFLICEIFKPIENDIVIQP
jgi:hypothetical protein